MPKQRRKRDQRAPQTVLYTTALGQTVTASFWRQSCVATPSLHDLEQALFSIASALPYPSDPEYRRKITAILNSQPMESALTALRALPIDLRPGLMNRVQLTQFALRFSRAFLKAA